MRKLLFISIIVAGGCSHFGADRSSARDEATQAPRAPGVVYSNPRVYNVDYSFEMFPDPNKIDRAKDLKVWIPIPREWDSQKAVRIISVQPEPHGRYVDSEYGNPMLFWDFGKMPEQASYKVDIKFRLESYQIDVDVDPDRVGSYDKTSREYALYTRSTHTIHITPKIRELAQEAIGNEKNPFLQAKRILFFANRKVHYKILDYERGRGIDCLLAYPVTDEKAGQFYKDYPKAKYAKEAFVCHMLRRQLGDEKFFELVGTYLDLRRRSGQAVPTSHFQKLAEDISGQSLDWFFRQWVDHMDVPWLKLDQVAARKEKEGWQVKGHLLQLGKTTFRLPIELALDTANGREMQRLGMDDKAVDFDFHTRNEPRRLVVDPDCEIFRVQKMAPRLGWFWDAYPGLIIVYGTLGETEANKTAAERLNKDVLVYGRECVKADIDVNDADLKTKCVFLIGRPETNLIAQQFKDIFPIKFDKNRFTWQGTTYAQPSQAVAQIVENPRDATSLMIMHAGLSPEAMRAFPYRYLYAVDGTYVIFDGDKQLLAGDWEDADSNLYWDFDTRSSDRSRPNQ